MPNKKIKKIISIISLLKMLKKVTTLGSAMPEWCLSVCVCVCPRVVTRVLVWGCGGGAENVRGL
jgi:hypothetical protein